MPRREPCLCESALKAERTANQESNAVFIPLFLDVCTASIKKPPVLVDIVPRYIVPDVDGARKKLLVAHAGDIGLERVVATWSDGLCKEWARYRITAAEKTEGSGVLRRKYYQVGLDFARRKAACLSCERGQAGL